MKKSIKIIRIREGGTEICPETKEMAELVNWVVEVRWFEGSTDVMGWEIGKVLGVNILNYAHPLKEILTDREKSWKHQKYR